MNFLLGEHIRKDLTEEEFEQVALEIFYYQAKNNPIYSAYLNFLGKKPSEVQGIDQIPFLPIELFKYHKIVTEYFTLPDELFVRFRSSGTTGMVRSTHYIYNIELYERSFTRGFEYFYGDVKDYVILALLPTYLEREDSSLIYMVEGLMQLSGHKENGFYLYDYKKLYRRLEELKHSGKKVLLLGVTFALLDFVKYYSLDFPELIVMETGGMKGRGPELVREQVHEILKRGFGVERVHSEYGMTELLSQAYSQGEGLFATPPWMKVLFRDVNDPFAYVDEGRTGGINVIDLANVYSCAFIETKDLGREQGGDYFEVLGRFDNSDIRGCNLLVI